MTAFSVTSPRAPAPTRHAGDLGRGVSRGETWTPAPRDAS